MLGYFSDKCFLLSSFRLTLCYHRSTPVHYWAQRRQHSKHILQFGERIRCGSSHLVSFFKSFIVRVEITNTSRENGVSFVSMVYPGELAGSAFGFNTFGVRSSFFSKFYFVFPFQLAITANSLFPKSIRAVGVPDLFLLRSLLAAKNMAEVFDRVNTPLGRTSGFSVNVGSVRDYRIFNLELSSASFAVTEVLKRWKFSFQNSGGGI